MSTSSRSYRSHLDAQGNLRPLLTGKGASRSRTSSTDSRNQQQQFGRKTSCPSERSLNSNRDLTSVRSNLSSSSRPNSASQKSRNDSTSGREKKPSVSNGNINLSSVTPEYIQKFWSKMQKETDEFYSQKKMSSLKESNISNNAKAPPSNGTANKETVKASVATRKPLLRRGATAPPATPKAPPATPKTPPATPKAHTNVVASVAVPLKSSNCREGRVNGMMDGGSVPGRRTSSNQSNRVIGSKPVLRTKRTGSPQSLNPVVSKPNTPRASKLLSTSLDTKRPPETKVPLVRTGILKKEVQRVPARSTVPTTASQKRTGSNTSIKPSTPKFHNKSPIKQSPSKSISPPRSPGDKALFLKRERLIHSSVLNHTVGGLIHPITNKCVKVPLYKPLRNIDGTIIKENGHCL